MRKKPRVNYSNEEKIDSKPIKTSLEAVTVLLRCIRVGCADLSQRHSDSPLSCHFSPAPSPSDPTETLHGRPSREGGKNKRVSALVLRTRLLSRASNGNDMGILDARLYVTLRDDAAATTTTTTTLERRLCQT